MKTHFYVLAIIILLNSFSISTYAARVLVHLSEPVNTAELAQLSTQTNLIYNLHPLPWLVLEIKDLKISPNSPLLKGETSTMLRTRIAGIDKNWNVQPDVQGHFATIRSSVTIPNDERYAEQWHLTEIGVPSLWEQTQGEGMIIALLDSGVDPDHPDLAANILFEQGYDFGDQDDKPDDESWDGHGTAMAGLMVAECHNQQGGCGVAPAAKVIPYKINQHGEDHFLASDLAAAILTAADSPAKILSLNLVLKQYSQIVQDALLYAKAQDKIIVAAAGNEGSAVAYPAYLPWIIGVGAFDQQGQRLRSSNYGNGLSLSAPGIKLLTTLPGTGYANWYRGTSPAAALVSGVLALIATLKPNATTSELIVTLLASCQDVDMPGFDSQYGFGHLKVPFSPNSTNTTKPFLKFMPEPGEVFRAGNILKLDLSLNNVTDMTADLYLRINLPNDSQGTRLNLFKVWNRNDSLTKIPYNEFLSSPYLLVNDLILLLYGSEKALLGTGILDSSLIEGAYELLALLTFTNNSSIQTRKIIWIY